VMKTCSTTRSFSLKNPISSTISPFGNFIFARHIKYDLSSKIKRLNRDDPLRMHARSFAKNDDSIEVIIPPNRQVSTIPFLITCEHASLELPKGKEWPKEDNWLVGTHWSVDLGSEHLARELSSITGVPALLAKSSRLWIDVNRPLDSPTLFRTQADGKTIHLNKDITEEEKKKRIEDYYVPYHDELKYLVKMMQPFVILSVHSFTPLYEGQKREMEVGVLYNHHEGLAKKLADFLSKKFITRVNEPWSGKEGFMYAASSVETPNSEDIKGIMLEIRQDLLTDSKWRKKFLRQLELFIVYENLLK